MTLYHAPNTIFYLHFADGKVTAALLHWDGVEEFPPPRSNVKAEAKGLLARLCHMHKHF